MKEKILFLPILLFSLSLFIACSTTNQATSGDNQIDQGYGKIAKKDRTTAISQTEIGEATASGNISWMELFQKTSGVTVKGNGRNLNLQIRGNKSMNNAGQPLFIVDGQIRGNGFENISFIDPGEVKRISILKDAASASAYGSRGADGVILVTLKK